MSKRFDWADVFMAVAAGVLTALYIAAAGGGFPLDDSWIHQTYGRNLGVLGEWSFIPGTPSAASTSPLYTLILAVGYALRVDFRVWTHGLGALALGVTGLLAMRLAAVLHPSRAVSVAVGAAVIGAWHLIWAAASGMETTLFGMLTLALILHTFGTLDHESGWVRRGVGFGVLAALCTLARPEGVVLSAMCGLAIAVHQLAQGEKERDSTQRRKDAKAQRKDEEGQRRITGVVGFAGAAGVMFVVVMLPYLLYNLNLTGGVLPNTASAKRAQAAILFGLPYLERVGRLMMPLLAGGQALLIPGVIACAFGRGLRVQRILLIGWGVGLTALYAAWLPLDIQHGRYVIPALPALIVAGVVGVAELADWVQRSLIGRVVVRSLMGAAAVIFLLFALTLGREAYQRDVAVIDGDMVAAARWIAANVPEDELLAIHDIGAVGYFAPRPLLDIGGLVSPEVIPIIRDGEALWALFEARQARWLMAYFYQTPGANGVDARLCPVFMSENTAAGAAGGNPLVVYRLNLNSVNERNEDGSCLINPPP